LHGNPFPLNTGDLVRKLLAALLGLLTPVLVPAPAQAQTAYPSRTISVIVPFSPGTGIDILGRVIAQKLSERWATGAVVDNKPGASSNIGTELVAKAAPDGHTLLMTATTFATNAAVNKNLRYDPAKSFVPISLVATGTMAFFASTNTPASTVQEFVTLAKAKPATLHYASSGNGTPQHLAMELFKLDTGIDLMHVPYKSTGFLSDVVGGRVSAVIMPIHTAAPYVHGGKMKMLAVMSAERSPVFPSVPTFAEAGFPNLQVDVWYGLLAPAGTSAEITARLNAEVNAMLALADVRELLGKQGLNPMGGAPVRLANIIKLDLERWPRVVASAGITSD
jgi:tripartite-type tricarboxylate transporter receptor subunit TctC